MRSPEPLKLRSYVPPGVYVPPFVSPEMEREPPVVGVTPMIVAQVPTAQAWQPVALSIHYYGISVYAADHERGKHEERTVAAHGGCSTSTLRSVLLSPRILLESTDGVPLAKPPVSARRQNEAQECLDENLRCENIMNHDENLMKTCNSTG